MDRETQGFKTEDLLFSSTDSKGREQSTCVTSAAFWPLLINDFDVHVKDFLKVKGRKVLKHGYNTNSLLGSEEFLGNVLALNIDCSRS